MIEFLKSAKGKVITLIAAIFLIIVVGNVLELFP
jgi:hypothetical protein